MSTTAKLKIVAIHHPGGDEFILPVQISKSLIQRLHPELVRDDPRYYEEEVGEGAFLLMGKLHKIDGVEDLCFLTHSMSVYYKPDVKKDEVRPKVIQWLKWHTLALLHRELDEEVEILELPDRKVALEHYHPDDSGRPGFNMPQ